MPPLAAGSGRGKPLLAGVFYGKSAKKTRQVGKKLGKTGKKLGKSAEFSGNLRKNSTTSLPGKPCLRAFRAARRAKRPSVDTEQPPPPYARERLAPLSVAEYVVLFLCIICNCCSAGCFAEVSKKVMASAVEGKCGVSLLPAASSRSGHRPLHDETTDGRKAISISRRIGEEVKDAGRHKLPSLNKRKRHMPQGISFHR